MTFEDWMRYRQLSESSVRKYNGAIAVTMSEWATDAGLLDGSLIMIRNYSRFKEIVAQLQELTIFKMRDERGHKMYSSAIRQYAEYLQEDSDTEIEEDVEDILLQRDITVTEKASLIKTRIGQGEYRQKLIALWGSCAVTGYQDADMLVASHIKPWRFSTNNERLDKYNGLLLLPTLDKAFDKGLITFEETGEIMISSLLKKPCLLGILSTMSVTLQHSHIEYVRFHREKVFRPR